ncbi:MAG: glycosyltransferase [Vicinamibacterales bacterium]
MQQPGLDDLPAPSVSAEPIRVAIVADLLEERWPSMDLVADMVLAHLAGPGVMPTLVRPSMRRRPFLARYINRYWDYPRWLRTVAPRFDVFHVVDHSYAHLVAEVDRARTVVTCHDADAFLPIVNPALNRSRLPRAIVRRVLRGLQAAAVVACPSAATRDEMLGYGLLEPERTIVVPNGVHPAFLAAPDPDAARWADEALGASAPTLDLLHVGTCIPRKRIDRLLDVVAAVRRQVPGTRLIKAGGRLTPEQLEQAARLGLTDCIVQMPFLGTPQLAALYRRADVVITTSEREGFGLPVVEALACGAPVVATDLPVFREVGGDAVRFVPMDDTAAWCHEVLAAADAQRDPQARSAAVAARSARAALFSWPGHAEAMRSVYARLAGRVTS